MNVFKTGIGVLCACLLAFNGNLIAQTSTGQMSITVKDPSGGVVPGATVLIIGADTGNIVRSVLTEDHGSVSVPLLMPGRYNVEVEVTGFQKLIRRAVTLRVNEALNLELTLQPGLAEQTITVTGGASLLSEKSHDLGQVVDEQTIHKLPLNGRNYLQLGNLIPGAVPNTRSRDQTFSAFGNRGLQNAFLLDGARNQNYLRGLDNRQRDAMRPSLEAGFRSTSATFSGCRLYRSLPIPQRCAKMMPGVSATVTHGPLRPH